MNNQIIYDNWYRANIQTNKENLYSPKEGFIKGNLFQNLYSEYKNYQPMNMSSKTDQEKLLNEIQAMSFATHDLNLYLDLNPQDQSIIMLFSDYNKQLENMMKEYEQKYGPLTVNNIGEGQPFKWVNTTWPWEGYHV